MEDFKKSSGGLMSSGKVVAEAAMSAFETKSVENIDKEKVAGASAEILDSTSKYAKLEDKPAGQYLEKAEVYLKQYSSGGTEKEKTDVPAAADAPKPAAEEAPKEPAPAPAPAAEEGKSSDGFGLDDVMKGAESLVEKKSGGEESGGGGFMKMAQGFMK
ncbi:hypothetical protein QYE76_051397 [Lolium multiflorum]|uniref:Uncharacterized protein n=1 Tax=Lolium multiflorum TaxID=4521 RepID=A0AAD8SRT2_LOLMU|nr:hypothetical protein QYE76_051397 [Lolium multiflorum]